MQSLDAGFLEISEVEDGLRIEPSRAKEVVEPGQARYGIIVGFQ
jgi:hypothetical protein